MIDFHLGEVLNGVILIPDDSESNAGIVLVHGAGAHDQNAYRKEAEAFAQNGITTLIYDKRTIGYRADGVGENSRSYSLLAEDALAAVKLLQSHPNVNSERVGLWGESEGGSVTTLAASRSGDVSFVITVGANGVPPIQQTSWHLENTLRHQGVTAHSFLNAVTRKSLRFALSAEMFAEATYQIIPVLERVNQPILAIWGRNDQNSPPAESAQIFQQALKDGGNEHYTIRFISNADHTLRPSKDGFTQQSDELTPEAMEIMTRWINALADGETFEPTMTKPIPEQARFSDERVARPETADSVWLHLAFIIVSAALFGSYIIFSLIDRLRQSSLPMVKGSIRWAMAVLSVLGLATTIGLFVYIFSIIMTYQVSFVIFGALYFGSYCSYLLG